MDIFVQEIVLWPVAVALQMLGIGWGRSKRTGFWPRLIAGVAVGCVLILFASATPKVVFFVLWGIGSVMSFFWALSRDFMSDESADTSLTFVDFVQDFLAGAMFAALAIALLRS